MKQAAKPRPSGNASLEKGLDLFNRIARDRGQTPLAALAAEMGLPRSTLYRLTNALEGAGMIARLERHHYEVGLPLAEALRGMTPESQLARLSRPALRRLASTCGATAHLGVMENDMVTYLVKESAGSVPAEPSFSRENTQLEAYCSGIGKVLLAWLPEEERARYLAGGPFVALTQRTITDPVVLQETLQTVKAEQFARDDGEIADDLYCLAVPLWTGDQRVAAAISLSFARRAEQRREDEGHLAMLRACAARLSIGGDGFFS
ncbi:IclR family transcriptional regulator [Acidocella aquatica]|uniref:IclR family transcriptional regulator n=1 Tax=Acidocella aquatica TaxID=1922313 RepID=A0ABQ6A732_9PROT|nr:IclR family transcriptional regulator [Acidocella aquatica]GLR67077.1 IclR family transcriptional regulator [Acidocella aquatica]